MPFQVSFPDMERELQQGLGNPFPTDAGIVLGNWSLRVGASGSIVGTTEAKEIKTTKHAERDAKHLSPKMKDCRGLELHLLSNGALVCALGPHACRRRRPKQDRILGAYVRACRMLGLAWACAFFRARAWSCCERAHYACDARDTHAHTGNIVWVASLRVGDVAVAIEPFKVRTQVGSEFSEQW